MGSAQSCVYPPRCYNRGADRIVGFENQSSLKEGAMRRLLFAIIVVLGLVTVLGSFIGCEKMESPTSPSAPTPSPTPNPNPTPLPSPVCTDQKATNYMGLLPCKYPPEGEVHLGYRTGFRGMEPRMTSYIPVEMPVMGYPGNVEARVVLDTPGTHLIRMALMTANNVTVIREVTVEVTSSGNIRLPFDGLSAIKPRINNANTDGRKIDGRVDFWFIADR